MAVQFPHIAIFKLRLAVAVGSERGGILLPGHIRTSRGPFCPRTGTLLPLTPWNPPGFIDAERRPLKTALLAVRPRLRNRNLVGSRVTISVSLVQVASRGHLEFWTDGRKEGHGMGEEERESMRVIYLPEWNGKCLFQWSKRVSGGGEMITLRDF